MEVSLRHVEEATTEDTLIGEVGVVDFPSVAEAARGMGVYDGNRYEVRKVQFLDWDGEFVLELIYW